MKNYLLRMIFTTAFFFICFMMNAQICVECPFNNCAYCWDDGWGDEFQEPGEDGGGAGGGSPAICNYHIGISGGAYAGVTINNGSCSGYVTLDKNPYDNSGSYSMFCRIHSSQVSCYRTQGGYYSSYAFTISHTQACGVLGFDLYFNYADTFYVQCFG